jgi:hypothetical protein
MAIANVKTTAIASVATIDGIAKAGLATVFGETIGGGGAIAEVGAGSQRAEGVLNGAGSGAISFPGNVTIGNMLVVGGSFYEPSGLVIAITDDVGTDYDIYQSGAAYVAWGVAPASGANEVTVDAGPANYGYFSIDEFSGVTQLDDAGAAATDTGTSVTAPITTVATDTLIIAAMLQLGGGTNTTTPEASWTEIGEEESAAVIFPYSFIFKIVNSAGLHTPEWTIGNSVLWRARSISLKA